MSKHAKIVEVENERMKNNIPDFKVGDTISIQVRIVEEGGKQRLQTYTGTVIARKGAGISETVSVHRVAYGEGMERVFFIHSPLIAEIKLVRRGNVRRSKLYYLRGTSGKASKVKGKYSAGAADEGKETISSEVEAIALNTSDVTA